MSDPKEDYDAIAAGIFAGLADAVAPITVDGPRLQRMRERVLAASAPPPAGTRTYRPADGSGWESPSELLRMKFLRVDEQAGTQDVLIRFLPGVRISAHSHSKQEEMIILEGECQVGEHALRTGDVHIAPPGSWHPEIRSQNGALVLLRCEYPFPA
jgi:quercetin dioxygenase-like cupin family protein